MVARYETILLVRMSLDMCSDSIRCEAFPGLFDHDFAEFDSCAGQLGRTDDFHEVLGDVLSRRVERNDHHGRVQLQEMRLHRVLLPDEEAVVPVLFDPHTELGLDLAEVNDPTNSVQRPVFGDASEMNAVVVTMQVTALALVPVDAVPTGDVMVTVNLVASHDYTSSQLSRASSSRYFSTTSGA